MKKTHKYNLGIIGNCSFLAYIDTHANIQWMCMPRFDSSFIFGALLDKEKGGEFYINPSEANFKSNQYYIPNTNVLVTEFECSDGSKFRVTDYAPRFFQHDRYFRPLMLFRKIEPISGVPSIRVVCNPVGNYGETQSESVQGSNHIRYLNIGKQVRLTSDIPLSYIASESSFVLSETKYIAFTYDIPLEANLRYTAEDFLSKTIHYWQTWIKNTYIGNYHQEDIIRSALVLKLHQYEDTGGIIASGSTSLPEHDQSGRNWDYRYCWIRDAYYTLNAFHHIGHFEELEKYFEYIENILYRAGDRIQPLFTILGAKEIYEKEIPLAGYLGNQPVRIGNDAYTHIQNDVYGQILASLLPIYSDKRLNVKLSRHTTEIIYFLLHKIEQTMNEPDAGIWEFRNYAQEHCYTFLFHWIGSKSAYKIAAQLNDEVLLKKAEKLIRQSAQKIEACYSPTKKAYTQAINSEFLDASCLQLISLQYLDPRSPIAAQHLEALEKELKHENGLFFRYKHQDDFGKPQSTFLVCAFWYVEALAAAGRIDDAIATFEQLTTYSNHLGLYSEDVGMDGSQWGNFPQTYSHVGLINAAYQIDRRMDTPSFH
jgi:GH15 family glucan-1,4-alpha-glucosidase